MDTKLPNSGGLDAARNTADGVAQALRDAILRGVVQGGQPLRQEDLAEQFGVSRLPVREALWQLSAEGLVTLAPNRGASVAALSADEVQEIYDIRAGLETTALRLSIPHLSPALLGRAADILDAIDRAADVARWSELNWAFHATLYAPAGRPRLLRLIRTMHANVDRYLRIYLALIGIQARSQREHRALLAACERHDTTAATQLLIDHLEGASTMLSAYLRRERANTPDW
jgi:DNA-binding GntR family transcriptional regulator